MHDLFLFFFISFPSRSSESLLFFLSFFPDWTGWKGVMVIGERGIPMGNDKTTTTDAKEKRMQIKPNARIEKGRERGRRGQSDNGHCKHDVPGWSGVV